MEEIWKPIKDYEGYYDVSNLGRVRSYPRRGTQCKDIRIMKLNLTRCGYLKVVLCKNHIHKNFEVHRLVAETFLSNENNYPVVNHKNGIKTDNRISNLEFCTYSYNTIDAIKHGLTRPKRIPINQYSKTGAFIKRWNSAKEASENLGINVSGISMTCNNKYKTSGGYVWRYAEK